MLRILYEFIRPSAKCKRIGHKPVDARYSVFTKPSESYSATADSGVLVRSECARCGVILDEGEVTKRSPIHSLTMNSEDMEQLRETGIFIRRKL